MQNIYALLALCEHMSRNHDINVKLDDIGHQNVKVSALGELICLIDTHLDNVFAPCAHAQIQATDGILVYPCVDYSPYTKETFVQIFTTNHPTLFSTSRFSNFCS